MNVINALRPRLKQARATWTLVTLNVCWYVLVELPHGLSAGGLVQTGALDGPDLHSGQWFRLVSSLFVHFNTSHLVFNMISLASMYAVELVIGWSAFVTVYGLAGICGSLVSVAIQPNALYGGASGAIFGIFGAALMLSLRGVFSKSTRNQLLFWLGLNIVFDFTQPDIGVMAHFCGLVVGMAGMWGLLQVPKLRRITRFTAWLVIAVFALGLAQAGMLAGLA